MVEYSIQSNHAHFVVEADGADALGRGMKALGARFARAVNRMLGRRGAVLLDRYHARILRTPREVRNALAYVLLNVRKHRAQRALATPASVDGASSGRWFTGWAGDVRSRHDPPVVAAAKSPLLRVGGCAGEGSKSTKFPADTPSSRDLARVSFFLPESLLLRTPADLRRPLGPVHALARRTARLFLP